MTTQISIKVSGPSRTIVRQDNQSAVVVNSNEEKVIILDGDSGSTMFALYMASTDMPYMAPGAMLDETKALAADPHEPDKSLEDRNRTFDPTEPAGRIDQPPDGRKAGTARELSEVGTETLGVFDLPDPAFDDPELAEAAKKREEEEANEASRLAGEEEARKKEEERVARESQEAEDAAAAEGDKSNKKKK
jgi:hypothetical protein